MKTNPNDSASPQAFIEDDCKGLTKREYMATHILAGLVAAGLDKHGMRLKGVESEEYPQHIAVDLTDALIEELNKEKK